MGHINPGRIKRPDEQQQPSVSGYDPSILFGQEPSAAAAPAEPPMPQTPPPVGQEGSRADQIPAKQPAKKQPSGHKTPKQKPDKAAKKDLHPDEEEEDTAGKDKYSIYLPAKLSMSMRMICILTRKKYSHITESALTDMLYRRYQCNNGACLSRFSISASDATPQCCPVCGEKRISPLRIDLP